MIFTDQLEAESKIIIVIITLLLCFSTFLVSEIYQELSIEERPSYSTSAKINYSDKIIPINVRCRNLYGGPLTTRTSALGCSYNYTEKIDGRRPLENHSLRAEIEAVKRPVLSNFSEPLISVEIDYSRNDNSGTLVQPPTTSGRYLLSLELENSSLKEGPYIRSSSPVYLRYYSPSEVTYSKYRSGLIILNFLVLSSVILQARSLILQIEKRKA